MVDDRPAAHEQFPALDGIRALAVAAVVAYHLSPSYLPGGYLGVDVFFVLSGFLITRLLLAERIGTGRLRLRAFWARRARRLLPGLFLMLVGLSIASMLVPAAVDPFELRSDGLAALFYFANWHFLATSQSYFGHIGPPSPLEHMWTLSIEEQFYVVWPLLLVGLYALVGRRSLRRLLGVVAGLALASVATMAIVYDGGRGLESAYFGTECRAFELLAGALAAIWMRSGSPSTDRAHAIARRALPSLPLQAAGLVGLAGVVAALCFARPSAFIFEGGLALVATATVLVVVASLGPGPVRQLFSSAPLRAVGRMSYEIYLWHWPVIVVADQELHFGGAGRAGFDIAVTLVLASASYLLVDAPLRRADFGSLLRRSVLPVSVAATCGLLLVTVQVGTSAAAPVTATDLGTAIAPATVSSTVFGVHLDPPTGSIDLGFRPSRSHPVRMMFVGDSVMYQLELALGAGLLATDEATTASYSGILGWSPRGGSQFALLARHIRRTHPDLVAVMWTQDNEWVGEHGIAAYEREVLAPLLDLLLRHGDGVRGIVFVGQPPQPPPHSWMPDMHADVYDPAGMRMWQQAARDESRLHPGKVAFVPATAMLEFEGAYSTWLPTPGGRLERVRQIDDFHLCLNGGVRYGAGAVQGIVRLLSLREPRANWWLGGYSQAKRWYQLPSYPPGECPNDAPAHLTKKDAGGG